MTRDEEIRNTAREIDERQARGETDFEIEMPISGFRVICRRGKWDVQMVRGAW